VSISRFTALSAIMSLILPIACLAQSEFSEGTKAEATLKNDYVVSVVLCQEQELEKAETVIQRGLDLPPGSATGKYFLGLAQFGLNHLVEAERSVRRALVRKARFAQAHFLLARIHQRQNNSAAVVEDLKAYLKLDPHTRWQTSQSFP
jgi:predicted Zn-dependent protease